MSHDQRHERGTRSWSVLRARAVLLGCACLTVSGCKTWTPIHETSSWTLFARGKSSVDVASFDAALEPAFTVVEAYMGPFDASVRVHAWDADIGSGTGWAGLAANGDEQATATIDAEDIGPAKVSAFHVRGGWQLFSTTGVFLGAADVGTAVHELVHARLAELDERVPLWFEEGLASLLGDGAWFEGAWTVDGLTCWPLRELREQDLGDDELQRLLSITARDDYDARDNLLVHFVGWAVVFDLRRELPDGEWRDWLRAFREGAKVRGSLREARRRLDRTLSWQTHVQWLNRLDEEGPAARFAAANGIWNLHSRSAIDRLLDRLEVEDHPEVRYALALNCMLASAEMRLGRQRWWRMRRLVFPILDDPQLADPEELTAARELNRALRSWNKEQRESLQESIEALSRFWEE